MSRTVHAALNTYISTLEEEGFDFKDIVSLAKEISTIGNTVTSLLEEEEGRPDEEPDSVYISLEYERNGGMQQSFEYNFYSPKAIANLVKFVATSSNEDMEFEKEKLQYLSERLREII